MGKYFHAITSHSAMQYRIVSGRASNTEQEERVFQFLKNISTNTSNHHPDHVILNSLIRIQVTDKIKEGNHQVEVTEKEISKLFQDENKKKINTTFKFEWIRNHPYEFQSHLERIADFLLLVDNIWYETNDGIVFKDLNNNFPKTVHHFRSFTLTEEREYLKRCWENLYTTSPHRIPAEKIKVEKDDDTSIIHLQSLIYFKILTTTAEDQPSKMNETFEITSSKTQLEITPSVDPINETIEITPPITQLEITPPSLEQTNEKIEITQPNEQNNDPEIIPLNLNLTIDFNITPRNTSTPIAAKKKNTTKKYRDKTEDSQEDSVTSIVPVLPVSTQPAISKLSKTATLLEDVLGKIDIIIEYDKLRKSYKTKKNSMVLQQLKLIKAKLEVKLVLTNSNCKKKLQVLELKLLDDNSDLSVLPQKLNDKREHKEIVHILKCVSYLRREFDI